MHKRAALGSGENCLVEVILLSRFLIAEDHASSRPAQCLMGSGGNHIRIRDRARMKPCGNQAGDMGHVHHQAGSHFIGSLSESLEVNGSCISGGPCNNHFRLAFSGNLFHFIIIDKAVVIHAVGYDIKIFSGHIHRASVCQMSAVIQVHAHDRISRIQYGKLYRHIGLCAGMGLYIGIVTAKQFFGAFNCQILYHIHTVASAVISLGRIPFRIFIGKYASHCGHNSLAHPVFRSNQLNMAVLSFLFVHNRLCDFRVGLLNIVQRIHPFNLLHK